MLVIAAVYTPQAASTVALIVPQRERPSAIAFVFLGWSLAVAGGLPLVTLLATQFGWRATYGTFAAISALIAILLLVVLPKGLKGHPLSLQSFGDIARNPAIMAMLLLTLLHTSGQFTIFIYLAPLLEKLTGAGAAVAGSYFAMLGVAGFVGNVIATSIVTRLGSVRTLAVCLGAILAGMIFWSVGAGWLPAMGAGVVIWGLGFAASNSMQQARLVTAAPALAGASVALNTSLLYIGQAVGSGVGGLLYANDMYRAVGYVATAFVVAAWVVLALTWERKAPSGL
jgi:predicted MFS family arabinose efflux permease